jgi:hypothetical protein
MGIPKNFTKPFGDKKNLFEIVEKHLSKKGITKKVMYKWSFFYFYYYSMWKSLLHTTFWGEQFSNFCNGYEIITESYFLWYPYWIIAKLFFCFYLHLLVTLKLNAHEMSKHYKKFFFNVSLKSFVHPFSGRLHSKSLYPNLQCKVFTDICVYLP